MKKRKFTIGFLVLFSVIVCLSSAYVLWNHYAVYGKYASVEPYVTGEAKNIDVVLSSQDSGKSSLSEAVQNNKGITTEEKANLAKLPDIPKTIGKKGSSTNPFIVLEIVPDKSERAVSFLVPTKEQGLPYDPLELGITLSKEFNCTIKDYRTNPTNFNNLLGNSLGGVFNNNNQYQIYSNDGTSEISVPYTTIKEYYKKTLTIADITLDEFNNKTVKTLANEKSNLFKKDDNGEDIKEIAIADENNWLKTSDKTSSLSQLVTFTDTITTDDYNNLSVKKLSDKYAGLFSKDSNNQAISSKTLADSSHWTKTTSQSTKWVDEVSYKPTKGYFVAVPVGTGEYEFSGNVWYANFEKKTGAASRFIYVDKAASLPSDAFRLLDKYHDYEVGNYLNSDVITNGYFAYNDIVINKVITSPGGNVTVNNYSYQYSNEEYQFTYTYYGMAVNDILKHRLFKLNSKDAYDNFHMKVISLTPSEINQMDQYDTADTLDYIERADMYYVAQFNGNDDNIKNHINFVRKYVENEASVTKDSSVTFYNYYGNDLEWDDCMRMIKRLSMNANVPLMYENVVGGMLDEGANEDNSMNTSVYLNTASPCVNQIGSLNNMAKTYLVTTQMDITKTTGTGRLFSSNIYPSMQKIMLTKQSQDKPYTAKYTGYYKRLDGLLAVCNDHTQDYKMKSYYLWGKALFYPNEVINDLQKLISQYGYSEEFINGGDPSSFNNNKYNGGMNRANSTRGGNSKNVTVVYDNSANTNKTILDNGGFNIMGRILEGIINNVVVEPEPLTVSIQPNKKDYTKLDESMIMIDYSKQSKYEKDYEYTLKCKVENVNNENSIITSLTFTDQDETKTKTLSIKDLQKENVVFSNGSSGKTGYLVAKNNAISIEIPFALFDMLKDYSVIHINTIARCSQVVGATTKYKESDSAVDHRINIVSRTYFDLE